MATMTALVLHGKEDLRFETRPIPQPTDGAVLIRIARAGICGSDIHYFQDAKVGIHSLKMPFVLGHEFCGEVVDAGIGVEKLVKGDRVVVEPAIPCGYCGPCRGGRYNLCENMRVFGSTSWTPHLNGGFEEYVLVPEHSCFKMTASLTYQQGAMVEPLAVGAHAISRAGVIAGKRIFITGAGTIGQSILTLSKAMGAASVSISDVRSFSRNFSMRRGADAALDPTDSSFLEQAKADAADGFDLVFEASGHAVAFSQAVELARRGATIVQVGMSASPASLDLGKFTGKELQLCGSFRYANAFKIVLDYLAAGLINVDELVTHVFKFPEAKKAMTCAIGEAEAIKVQIEF